MDVLRLAATRGGTIHQMNAKNASMQELNEGLYMQQPPDSRRKQIRIEYVDPRNHYTVSTRC